MYVNDKIRLDLNHLTITKIVSSYTKYFMSDIKIKLHNHKFVMRDDYVTTIIFFPQLFATVMEGNGANFIVQNLPNA